MDYTSWPLSAPVNLTWEITRQCNLSCIHCLSGSDREMSGELEFEECRSIVVQHHERNDGTGYPRKIRGNDIHIYGRICSVADVYDALVSKRPYKPSLQPFEALKIMRDEMLGHFQKDIFEKFVLLFT